MTDKLLTSELKTELIRKTDLKTKTKMSDQEYNEDNLLFDDDDDTQKIKPMEEEVNERQSAKRSRTGSSTESVGTMEVPIHSSTSTTTFKVPPHVVNQPAPIVLEVSQDLTFEESDLTLEELALSGDRPYRDLSNGAKLLVRLRTLSVDPNQALIVVNLLRELRGQGVNTRMMFSQISTFQFPPISRNDVDELASFDNIIPDNFSSSVLSDPKLDRIFMSRSNFLAIFRILAKYVNSCSLLENGNLSITFKSLKTIELSSLMCDSENPLTRDRPPLTENDQSQLLKLFTGLSFVGDLSYLSMLHEYAGMFPHEVDKRTGVSHNPVFRSSPPFAYNEGSMSQFLDRISSGMRPALPHLQVSRSLASLLSTYKLGHWFACAPGDTYSGHLFIPVKLSKALESCDSQVSSQFGQLGVSFRQTAYKNLLHKLPQFSIDTSVIKDMKEQVTTLVSLLNAKSFFKNRLASVLLDLFKGCFYYYQSFLARWSSFSDVVKKIDGKQDSASIFKFLSMITGTDNRIEQLHTVSRYTSVLANLSKVQDVLTPLNDNFSFGKSYLVNTSIRLAVAKSVASITHQVSKHPILQLHADNQEFRSAYESSDSDRLATYLSKEIDRMPQPILISEKGPFADAITYPSSYVPFSAYQGRPIEPDAGILRFLFTKNRSSHEDHLYNYDLAPFVASFSAVVRTIFNRGERPVIILCLKKLPLRFIRSFFKICDDLSINEFLIIGTLQEVIQGEQPLIHTTPETNATFPSILNSKVEGSFNKEFLPVVSFGLTRLFKPLTVAPDHSSLPKGINNTYSRLAWGNVFVFLNTLNAIGRHTKGPLPNPKMTSSLLFSYLESALSKFEDSTSALSYGDILSQNHAFDLEDMKGFGFDD